MYRFNDVISEGINLFTISALSYEGKGLHRMLQNKWLHCLENDALQCTAQSSF